MSSGYDKDNDRRLAEKSAFNNDKTEIRVGIYKYGTGQPKIQIHRVDTFKGETRFVKLGRLSLEEFIGVARAVKELEANGAFRAQ